MRKDRAGPCAEGGHTLAEDRTVPLDTFGLLREHRPGCHETRIHQRALHGRAAPRSGPFRLSGYLGPRFLADQEPRAHGEATMRRMCQYSRALFCGIEVAEVIN